MRRVFARWSEKKKRLEPSLPAGLRLYVVGDIHGCSDLLVKLQSLVAEDWRQGGASEGQIIYLGDYVDRGPDSAGVLGILTKGHGSPLPATFLRGNHEFMLETFFHEPNSAHAWRQLGGMETLLSYRIDINSCLRAGGNQALADALASAMPEDHRVFLQCLEPSTTIGDYFFCHAGVRPGVPLASQTTTDLYWIRDEFLAATGDFGKVVVHGHTPCPVVEFRDNRINVDTGAYATGRLSCLVLQGKERRVLTT